MNYLARLGWSHGDQEIFTRAELVERFDIKDVSPRAPSSTRPSSSGCSRSTSRPAPARGWPSWCDRSWPRRACRRPDDARLAAMLETLRERAKTLREMVRGRPVLLRAAGRLTTTRRGPSCSRRRARRLRLADRAAGAPSSPSRRPRSRGSTASWPPRSASSWSTSPSSRAWRVTGRTASPPLFDVLALLGREETLARLRAAPRPRRRRDEAPAGAPRRVAVERRAALSGRDRHRAVGAGPGAGRTRSAAGCAATACGAAYVSPLPARAWRRPSWRSAGTGIPLGRRRGAARALARRLGGAARSTRSGAQRRRPLRGVAAGAPRLPAAGRRADAGGQRARAGGALERIAAAHAGATTCWSSPTAASSACTPATCSAARFNQLWRLRVDNASLRSCGRRGWSR